MILKVLKSPSSVGHISTNEHYLFYAARPSVVRYTLYARCVLQNRFAVIVQTIDIISLRPYHIGCTAFSYYNVEWLLHWHNGVPPYINQNVAPVAP